jgi:predicted nucleic acid-binding protein
VKQVLLDANALVSFLTDRQPGQQEEVEALLVDALHGDQEIILHQHVLSETIFVLKNVYQVRSDVISKMLFDLLHQPGITTTNDLDWMHVLKLWPSKITDVGDAVLASVALLRSWEIATFDQAFRRRLNALKIRLTSFG